MEWEQGSAFHTLYHTDFTICDVFAMRQSWTRDVVFSMSEPRKSTALILLDCCTGVYAGNDFCAFTAKDGVVCLPQGSRYTCHNLDCTHTKKDAILINFNLKREGEPFTLGRTPFLLSHVSAAAVRPLFCDVVDAYEDSAFSPVALQSALWRLLSYLGRETERTYQQKFQPIARGIALLESNPLCELSVSQIAAQCNVSEGYFRRLFLEYAHQTPTEYRLERRLELAKRMLENEEATVAYVSQVAGFESASYFCRIFRKKTGMSPGQYRQQIKERAFS